jgi:hypothetical protein
MFSSQSVRTAASIYPMVIITDEATELAPPFLSSTHVPPMLSLEQKDSGMLPNDDLRTCNINTNQRARGIPIKGNKTSKNSQPRCVQVSTGIPEGRDYSPNQSVSPADNSPEPRLTLWQISPYGRHLSESLYLIFRTCGPRKDHQCLEINFAHVHNLLVRERPEFMCQHDEEKGRLEMISSKHPEE